MEKKELNSRVANWALKIQEFHCNIQHKAGTLMRHVDALSRHPIVMTVENEVLHSIKKAQHEDENCKLILEMLKNINYEDYSMQSGILYKFTEGRYLVVVPKSLQQQIIQNIHEQSHSNQRKVEFIVRQEYHIPNLSKKIDKVIANCIPCILGSRKRGKQEGFLNPIDKADVPLHTYHLDHLGPLPSTTKNYKYLLVVVDAFSKFTWLYPTKNTTAEEVVKKLNLQSEVFGNPYRIVTDKSAAFTSNLFRDYCQDQKITHLLTTTGVPRGNGQAERINQIIIEVLTKMSVKDPLKWYKHVPQSQRVINSTISRSTNRTPFRLLLGTEMFKTEDHNLTKALEEEIFQQFEEDRKTIRVIAKKQISKVQEENRKGYNRKRKAAFKYKLGDLVEIERTQFGPGLKLHAKFLGPYEVKKVKRNDRYDLNKVGIHEGPNSTSSSADHMKLWKMYEDSEAEYSDDESQDSSGTDEMQDGRM